MLASAGSTRTSTCTGTGTGRTAHCDDDCVGLEEGRGAATGTSSTVLVPVLAVLASGLVMPPLYYYSCCAVICGSCAAASLHWHLPESHRPDSRCSALIHPNSLVLCSDTSEQLVADNGKRHSANESMDAEHF
jgi:hypothetical protein